MTNFRELKLANLGRLNVKFSQGLVTPLFLLPFDTMLRVSKSISHQMRSWFYVSFWGRIRFTVDFWEECPPCPLHLNMSNQSLYLRQQIPISSHVKTCIGRVILRRSIWVVKLHLETKIYLKRKKSFKSTSVHRGHRGFSPPSLLAVFFLSFWIWNGSFEGKWCKQDFRHDRSRISVLIFYVCVMCRCSRSGICMG